MLSDKRITEEMGRGNIVIEPFRPQHLGTNSYDGCLGEWYFQGNIHMQSLHIGSPDEVIAYWGEPKRARDHMITIAPGATILAHTQEVIGGKNGFLARMHARSTIARCGLSVCRCAGVGDVGYIDSWTMEISNHTHAMITIPTGMRVCQFTFEEVGETLKHYDGKYHVKERPWRPEDMLPKPWKDFDYTQYNRQKAEIDFKQVLEKI